VEELRLSSKKYEEVDMLGAFIDNCQLSPTHIKSIYNPYKSQGVRCVVTAHKVADVWSHSQGVRCVVTAHKVADQWHTEAVPETGSK